jgi:hypothetical protein
MKPHPYLQQAQFRDKTFLLIRRRVWLILLPYCAGEQRTEAERLIGIYDDLLAR